MNNKTLSLFGLVPMWLMFTIGFVEGLTDTTLTGGGFDVVVGLLIIIFTTWGLIRLYKIQ